MHKTLQAFRLPSQVLTTGAALVVIGMLLAFHAVVQGAVRDGESRRQASATQAAVAWRCSLVRDLPARDRCLLQTHAAVSAIESGTMHASAMN